MVPRDRGVSKDEPRTLLSRKEALAQGRNGSAGEESRAAMGEPQSPRAAMLEVSSEPWVMMTSASRVYCAMRAVGV